MYEAIGLFGGFMVGLVAGLLVSFIYLKYKVARLTANAQAAAIDFAAGKLKEVSASVVRSYLKKRGQANA